MRSETGADIVTHERFRMIWDRIDPPDLDVEDVADDRGDRRRIARVRAQPVGSAAVGRRGR